MWEKQKKRSGRTKGNNMIEEKGKVGKRNRKEKVQNQQEIRG